eukprot:7613708-Alexandrium_andersonii.AAC.1
MSPQETSRKTANELGGGNWQGVLGNVGRTLRGASCSANRCELQCKLQHSLQPLCRSICRL